MFDYQSLETERLMLRPSSLEDVQFVFELLNSPKWIKYIGNRQIISLDAARKYITEKMTPKTDKLGVNFTVMRKVDSVKIGSCGIYNREGLGYMDIGFAFLPEYEQKGYAFESAKRVLKLGFDEFGVDRVCAITTKDNFSSQRLIEKLGMSYQKIIRIPNDDEDLMLYYLDAL